VKPEGILERKKKKERHTSPNRWKANHPTPPVLIYKYCVGLVGQKIGT
jgi:hypothetical protein